MLTRFGGTPVCDYGVDNLKWNGKSIMNSTSIDICESIEKDLGIRANGHTTYASVISKIRQFRSFAIRNLVDELRKMYFIKEPVQDVNIFGSRLIKKTPSIVGYGSATSNNTSIAAH